MKTLTTTRRPGGPTMGCSHAAPRLKPNELHSWMLRSLRSRLSTELPTRSDLEEFFAQFDLSEAECVELVDGLCDELVRIAPAWME